MKRKCLGLLFVLCGIMLMIGAVAAEIAWLGICFGTVIIGVLLLIFAPLILFAPFSLLFSTGGVLWGNGLSMISED